MKLRFTPRAVQNIAKIADYVREHNPSAASRVRASIYDSLSNLILFPFLGRAQKEPGVRKFIAPRYGYLIYYLVDKAAEEIIVLNVRHPAQRREHEDA